MVFDIETTTQGRLLALMEETGYPVTQINGQRIYGPPTSWVNRPPPENSEIFIGKIPRDVFEDELVPILSSVGEIYKLRLMMDFSGTNRGYAFAMLANRSSADRAVRDLHGMEVRPGRFIGVVKSRNHCRLYVGGLPETASKTEITEELKLAMEGVTGVIIYSDVFDKSKHRGFAFVDFMDHRSAALARRKFLPESATIFGLPVAIDWAEQEIEVEQEIMDKVKVLFVRNVMPCTSESTLHQVFSSAVGRSSSVEKVKKTKDFAFIHFDTRAAAAAGKNYWNGRCLDGSELSVVWAKPIKRDEHQMFKSIQRFKRHGYVRQSPMIDADQFVENWPNCGKWKANSHWRINEQPILMLANKCYKFGFGEPTYDVCEVPSLFGKQYVCKVTLPHCLGMARSFMFEHGSTTAREAQLATCKWVLDHIQAGTLVNATLLCPPLQGYHYMQDTNYLPENNYMGSMPVQQFPLQPIVPQALNLAWDPMYNTYVQK